MTFVVDNSVALAWCFEDEQTPAIMSLLERLEREGAFAPQLWPIEALNGLLVAVRRGRISSSAQSALVELLMSLPIVIDSRSAIDSLTRVTYLAEFHNLTAYDATYLELAIWHAVPLATRDKALITAARAAKVPLLETL